MKTGINISWRLGFIVLGLMIMGFSPWSCAEEHPSEKTAEHPKESEKKAEHPAEGTKEKPAEKSKEQPKKGEHPQESKALNKIELAEAVEAYVNRNAALKGGYFLVYDKHIQQALVLTLDKVHKDRLSRVGDNVYFACADFKTPEGKVYDLDIFMKGPDKDHLEVTDIGVHKEDGSARYTWYEQKGIWKKKPVS